MTIIDAHIPHGGGTQNPEEIVIHAMGEYIKDKEHPTHAVAFLNEYKLSAHVLIAPSDIYRCRNDTEQAWHARGHNRNSLGIEFLVPGQHDYGSFVEAIKSPYLIEEQFKNGIMIVQEWMNLYPIKRIRRHSDISPGRKVDPGDGFPWEEFLNEVG